MTLDGKRTDFELVGRNNLFHAERASARCNPRKVPPLSPSPTPSGVLSLSSKLKLNFEISFVNNKHFCYRKLWECSVTSRQYLLLDDFLLSYHLSENNIVFFFYREIRYWSLLLTTHSLTGHLSLLHCFTNQSCDGIIDRSIQVFYIHTTSQGLENK